eukprot:scaffold46174_cov25-Prasinocladus_malaysianus.AAC.3
MLGIVCQMIEARSSKCRMHFGNSICHNRQTGYATTLRSITSSAIRSRSQDGFLRCLSNHIISYIQWAASYIRYDTAIIAYRSGEGLVSGTDPPSRRNARRF